eukprot:6203903-Prymnesium_polylepis.2
MALDASCLALGATVAQDVRARAQHETRAPSPPPRPRRSRLRMWHAACGMRHAACGTRYARTFVPCRVRGAPIVHPPCTRRARTHATTRMRRQARTPAVRAHTRRAPDSHPHSPRP